MNTADRDSMRRANLIGLIFSKDRAMQLCATLESLQARCRDRHIIGLHVLYRASDEFNRGQYATLASRFRDVVFIEEHNFREQTIEIVGAGEHVLFLVDDNLFVRDFHAQQTIDWLGRHPDAVGFSLRLGRNTTHNYNRNARMRPPAFQAVGGGVLKYDWTGQKYDFGYPLEISSSIYRTADVLGLISRLDFCNPNLLEGLMAANAGLYAQGRPQLLCFELSAAFCNPCNMVQTVCKNRTGGDAGCSAEKLAALYANGQRIHVEYYNGLIPRGCHQDVELVFRTDEGGDDGGPLVTVEMITYNQQTYIRRAIDSVLAQTYRNFELVIVDDGSTDATRSIVESYRDPRVRIILEEHKGRWAGTNRLLGEARGEYIVAVDSDDYIGADYLEKMVACAERHREIDFFYPAELFLVDGQDRHTGARWQYQDFSDNSVLPSFLFRQGFSPIPYPGSLRRRRMYETTGGYDELPNVADFVFLCKNARKISFMRVDRHGTYYYRVLTQSLSRNFEERDRNIARTLHEMVSIYQPEVICPKLKEAGDPDVRMQLYYIYLREVFYRHAGGYHMIKNGEHFRQYGDYYNTLLQRLGHGPHGGSFAGNTKGDCNG